MHVRKRNRQCSSPKDGMRQSWTEWQIVYNRKVLHRFDTAAQALAKLIQLSKIPPSGGIITIEDAKHAYNVEVEEIFNLHNVEVHCNNRTQAASLARRMGFIVRSVNMIG